MLTSRKKSSDARAVLSRPVERALHRLGQDISAARRMRRLSQEDLAQRIGTSLSTVRRMEDGYPGTALHTFLGALQILGRLDAVLDVMAIKNDALGLELIREQLPQRVRTSSGNKPHARRPATAKENIAHIHTEKLEGF